MHAYVYTCTHTYTYICMYIHACKLFYVKEWPMWQTRLKMMVSERVNSTYREWCLCICTCLNLFMCVQACMYLCMYVYVHVCTCMFIYIYIYIYICTVPSNHTYKNTQTNIPLCIGLCNTPTRITSHLGDHQLISRVRDLTGLVPHKAWPWRKSWAAARFGERSSAQRRDIGPIHTCDFVNQITGRTL
jgi:hypothetical protein